MEVRQTVVLFSIPKADVAEVKSSVFFRFGNEKVSEPKNKIAITDDPDDSSRNYVFIWKWVFEKVPTFVANADKRCEFYVSKTVSVEELKFAMKCKI